MIDYLIIGGGYAGLMLAAELMKKHHRVQILDEGFEQSPSAITSGLINPITGRNLVKSWQFNAFHQAAIPFYQQLQQELGIPVIEPMKLCRILQNPREWNEYSARKEMQEYAEVIGNEITFDGSKYSACEGFEIKHAYRIHIPAICQYYRQKFLDQSILQQCPFASEQLTQTKKGWRYEAIETKAVVFCEGAKGIKNPFFHHIEYIPAIGEYLLVHIPRLNQEFILNQHKVLVPYGNDLYWFGATFRWDLSKPVVTDAGKQELMTALNDMIQLPFEVVEHGGAIRPTVKDRRPVMGCHTAYPSLYIFNGFGTKAASMMPYFVQQFVEVLEGKKQVESEVDHMRFAK